MNGCPRVLIGQMNLCRAWLENKCCQELRVTRQLPPRNHKSPSIGGASTSQRGDEQIRRPFKFSS